MALEMRGRAKVVRVIWKSNTAYELAMRCTVGESVLDVTLHVVDTCRQVSLYI